MLYSEIRQLTWVYMALHVLSQGAMADRIGCSVSALRRWVASETGTLEAHTMERLVSLLRADGLMVGDVCVVKSVKAAHRKITMQKSQSVRMGRPIEAVKHIQE